MNDSEFDSDIEQMAGSASYFSSMALSAELRKWLSWCESPIEKKLIIKLGGFHFGHSCFGPINVPSIYVQPPGPPLPLGQPPSLERIAVHQELHIFCQQEIGSYRVDFLCVAWDHENSARQFVVECDGHDFHERTKEQARKDRARDRALTKNDYTVLRYTGAEIHESPGGCIMDLWSHLWPDFYNE